MVSLRTVNGAHPSGVRYCVASAGLICSRYKSCTSGPVLVKPQATLLVRPSTTKGRPGKVAPTASMGPKGVPSDALPAGACRLAKYQMAGADRPRCGSLASSGFPLPGGGPPITPLLLPLPSLVPALRVSSSAQASMPALICRDNGPSRLAGATAAAAAPEAGARETPRWGYSAAR